jgi:hypothetical protein
LRSRPLFCAKAELKIKKNRQRKAFSWALLWKSRQSGTFFPPASSGQSEARSPAVRPYAAIARHDSAQASQSDALIHAADTPAVLRALGADFRAFPARMLVVGRIDQHEMG